MSTNHIYNLKPTPVGHENHPSRFSVAAPSTLPLPPILDLTTSSFFDAIYDQSSLGSCTGNGFSRAVNYDLRKQNLPALVPNPSRLFIYWNERSIENSVAQDSGASLGDGISALKTYGVCSETTWPYDINQFTVKPINEAYTEAANNALIQFNTCLNINDIKQSIANGFPVVIGITLFDSFESSQAAATGIITVPTPSEQILGGHCMTIVGYDDTKSWVKVANSWGTGWGDKGYCYIPYANISANLMEAYTLTFVK
jgi:C1A family cysteine protease